MYDLYQEFIFDLYVFYIFDLFLKVKNDKMDKKYFLYCFDVNLFGYLILII